MKRVAIILHRYGNPSQPYITEWFSRLVSVPGPFLVRGFADSCYKGVRHPMVTRCKPTGLSKVYFYFFSWVERQFGLYKDLPSILVPIVKFKPDLIHLLNAQQFDLYLPVIRALNVPVIISFRGFETNVRPHQDLEWQNRLKFIYSQASGLHFVSDFLKDQAVNFGASCEKSKVIRRSVAIDFFRPSNRVDIKHRPIQILAVGRLVWQKGYPFLLASLARLKGKGFLFQLTILGEGVEYENLIKLVGELNLTAEVKIKPPVSRSKLLACYQEADIFVQASASEGLPNTVLEASACGLPVVATSVGGIPEAVIHNETGFLCPFGDSELFAQSILILGQDESLRKLFGRNARRRMELLFSSQTEGEGWMEYYSLFVGT